MTTTNVILICPAAHRVNINAVIEAMGHGPGSISIKLTTVENPHWSATATHYGASWQGCPMDVQAQLLAATTGDLPPVAPGVVWGENGVISAPDAMTAMAALAVASFSDAYEPLQQLNAAMGSYDPVLHRIPDNDEE